MPEGMGSPGTKEIMREFCSFMGFRGEESLETCTEILTRLAESEAKTILLSEAHRVSGTAKWVTSRLRKLGILELCSIGGKNYLCPSKEKLLQLTAAINKLWG
jgi:hypothetical protein